MASENPTLRERRHVDKITFINSDDRFYEPDYDHYTPSDELAAIVRPLLAAHGRGWEIRQKGVWSHVMPGGDAQVGSLPIQGWKIHLSAIEDNCRAMLADAAALLLEQDVPFKFANDCRTMRMMTSKRWPRGGSGKFITVYPHTEGEFIQVIEALYQALGTRTGSYILSDRRYKDSRCLYYRYGGIIQVSHLDIMGKRIPMLVGPSGEHMPDRRNPYFESPPWAQDPFPSDEDGIGDRSLNEGRYLVESALGFSNTGGVYLSIERATGRQVVIKEARPHVELYENGGDATTRLKREMENLNILSPLGIAPAVLDTFWDWENLYVVEEYVDAHDMRHVMLQFSPLMKVRPTLSDSDAFYAMYRDIFVNLVRAVDLAHGAGMVIGDLSPPNILVAKDSLAVRLIDLEAAFRPGLGESEDIHTPGFRSKLKSRARISSYEDDHYPVAAIMMYAMFPIVAMAYIRDDLFDTVLPEIVWDIGWKDTPVMGVIRDLAQGKASLKEAEERLLQPVSTRQPYASKAGRGLPADSVLKRLAAFIQVNYRLDPKYTLFPCDPFALATNASSLGFGSSGVIYALIRAGVEVPQAAWDRHLAEVSSLNSQNAAPGFLTGLAGIGWAHLAMGEAAIGLGFVEQANRSVQKTTHPSLYYGMAGLGLADLAAYVVSGHHRYLDLALELAAQLESSALQSNDGLYWEDDGVVRIGFGYGQSGIALFFLRLSQAAGDERWRTLGKAALCYDLAHGHELEAGVTTFAAAPAGITTYEHYIEQGTAGIVKVAIRYGLWETVDQLVLDLHRKYAGFAGLLYGLAGLIDTLVDAHVYSGNPRYLEMAQRAYQGLTDLYVFGDDDMAAVPGENLFRISCDYATGMAGIIRAIQRLSAPDGDDFCLDVLDGPLLKRTGAHAVQASA